jgi:DNA adenine methylase
VSEPLKPFLKWAGGKRSLIAQFEPHFPESFGRYHEPFIGSGALFFHLRPKRASISDNNERLIRTYLGIRDATDEVIALLEGYPHEREFFLSLRRHDIDAESDPRVAAWFIYLNKTGFNGLYRVNSKNKFNVPFGDYKRPKICDHVKLRACAKALKKAKIEHVDFEVSARRARKGDLVYFDPPYVPLSATSSFTSYTQHGFGMDEQRRLRDLALALKKRGVHVLLSNSSAASVRELYADGFEQINVKARRAINSKGSGRGEITELLIK